MAGGDRRRTWEHASNPLPSKLESTNPDANEAINPRLTDKVHRASSELDGTLTTSREKQTPGTKGGTHLHLTYSITTHP